MRMSHAMQRLTLCIAMCAILMTALAPSISHAIAAASNVPNAWSEICSVDGSKLVKLSGDQQPPAPVNHTTHFEHCPFCMMYAVNFGMSLSAGLKLPVLEVTHITPTLFYQASRPLFAWTTAQPRAPPFFS